MEVTPGSLDLALLSTPQDGFHIEHAETAMLLAMGDHLADLVVRRVRQMEHDRRAGRQVDQIIAVIAEVARDGHVGPRSAGGQAAPPLDPLVKEAVGEQSRSGNKILPEKVALLGRAAAEIRDIPGSDFELVTKSRICDPKLFIVMGEGGRQNKLGCTHGKPH
ncbi:MAG: hypothetical protein BGO05_00830 [Rhizobiales bacterium 63-7]|nr:MAG: hypothetical protein BGO05_00830 [Rhizobiales bacterium 63-7]